MRKSEDVEINGVRYTINQLGALEGHKIFAELAQVLSAKPGAERLIGDLFLVPGLIETMARATLVHMGPNQKPVLWTVLDNHFAGDYESMGEWLNHCIRLNFQSRKAAPAGASNG